MKKRLCFGFVNDPDMLSHLFPNVVTVYGNVVWLSTRTHSFMSEANKKSDLLIIIGTSETWPENAGAQEFQKLYEKFLEGFKESSFILAIFNGEDTDEFLVWYKKALEQEGIEIAVENFDPSEPGCLRVIEFTKMVDDEGNTCLDLRKFDAKTDQYYLFREVGN